MAKAPGGDRYFQIQVSRNTLIAILLSLLLHALLLFSLAMKQLEVGEPAGREKPTELVVQLAPKVNPKPVTAEAVAPAEVEPEPAPPPKSRPPSPKPSRKKAPPVKQKESPPVLAAPHVPVPEKVPVPLKRDVPAERPAETPSPPVTDMMSYVNAQRERRRAAGDPGQLNEDAAAKERGPTAEEIREANIKRNLTDDGGGVFQITHLGPRGAKFIFRGWKHFSNPRTEFVEVEAPPDGDVERAVVRKMIEIIRRDYKGDFNWESKRLGRTVTLSARPQDNEGLEDFLLKDFPWPNRLH